MEEGGAEEWEWDWEWEWERIWECEGEDCCWVSGGGQWKSVVGVGESRLDEWKSGRGVTFVWMGS